MFATLFLGAVLADLPDDRRRPRRRRDAACSSRWSSARSGAGRCSSRAGPGRRSPPASTCSSSTRSRSLITLALRRLDARPRGCCRARCSRSAVVIIAADLGARLGLADLDRAGHRRVHDLRRRAGRRAARPDRRRARLAHPRADLRASSRYAVPFEALYQQGLYLLTSEQPGLTGVVGRARARSAARRRRARALLVFAIVVHGRPCSPLAVARVRAPRSLSC